MEFIGFGTHEERANTISFVDVEFDPAKSEKNVRERALSFSEAALFDFKTASTVRVFRNGELRLLATGFLDERIHVLCFKQTLRGIRVISFRKANQRDQEV